MNVGLLDLIVHHFSFRFLSAAKNKVVRVPRLCSKDNRRGTNEQTSGVIRATNYRSSNRTTWLKLLLSHLTFL